MGAHGDRPVLGPLAVRRCKVRRRSPVTGTAALHLVVTAVDALRLRRLDSSGQVFADRLQSTCSSLGFAMCTASVSTKSLSGKLHALRHSFASNLCAAGAAPIVVQRLGRWSDLRVMQRYAHLHEDALREGIELLAKHGDPTEHGTSKA